MPECQPNFSSFDSLKRVANKFGDLESIFGGGAKIARGIGAYRDFSRELDRALQIP
jgi:hypothetical protein